ncbi:MULTISPECIES: SGM_5486 family transporter-associated protein [unclassified Streptomyces]|uniref:SGM_5486 family transporter-associated protein n=1 Tax=Streptomyces hazeniae TaxID=3075538 RepID=A0ABU2P1C2_9ACTN|nr:MULTISPECIES: SGM_5486 family transporter-associated protein [unclassified Streptomyces]MDT0381708.1 SGM_5486 family transporter-associated protein [Streptomyces sp. DSM 42041]
MPVLEPEPQGGQKKLLLLFAAILGIMVVIGVVASIAAP